MNTEELKNLLNIPDLMNPDQIIHHIDNLISKQDNQKLKEFLQNAKNILTPQSSDNEISEIEGLENMDTSNAIHTNETENLGEMVFTQQPVGTKPTDYIMTTENGTQVRSDIPIQKVHTTDYTQGKMNPNFIETYSAAIILKSSYAAPTSTNPLNNRSNPFQLNVSFKNVTSMRFSSIILPPSWYSFDSNFGNTSFSVSNGTDISCIQIESGHYDISNLIVTINEDLSNKSIDASFSYATIPNKVTLSVAPTSSDLSFNFYDPDGICDPSYCPVNSSTLNYNLGYFLGYRQSSQSSTFIINMAAGASQLASSQVNLNTNINAILTVDDYNNNVFAEKVALSEVKDNTLTRPPSYYSKDISCNPNSSDFQVLASNPRKLSLAQLYTIGAILGPKTQLMYQEPKHLTNTLATFALTANTYFANSFNTADSPAKTYLGPVNISRLKISLLDSNGNLLNLNEANWECTLHIEQQYQ